MADTVTVQIRIAQMRTSTLIKLITTFAEPHEAGNQIYLIATEAHGNTRKKSFMAFILPCFSVCFRGKNIFFQIKAVQAS